MPLVVAQPNAMASQNNPYAINAVPPNALFFLKSINPAIS